MAFSEHQNKIYESLRDLLDIQPKCDYNIDIAPYHHVNKITGLHMGVTARLMTYFMGTIYLSEDRRNFLGMKAQVIHSRSMVIGPLEDEQLGHEGRGHFTLQLTENGETKTMKMAWNNTKTDAAHISNIMFEFIDKAAL